ncbi:MAG: 6-phosphogluconolactonase, partial [Promicromonosporaceae bacterium]|nr:6-phosphogluconolactonase [Promicromonosporaceae bacterium]
EANIHPIPGPDATGSPEEAATRYAATLDLEQARFDVCLLGMGPDGHVASLFPGHPALMAATAGEAGAAIAVHDSPKPPPTRVSLTLAILNESREVWLVVAGCEKAEMVAAGLERAEGVPAGMVGGRRRTLWLLDTAAADSPN